MPWPGRRVRRRPGSWSRGCQLCRVASQPRRTVHRWCCCRRTCGTARPSSPPPCSCLRWCCCRRTCGTAPRSSRCRVQSSISTSCWTWVRSGLIDQSQEEVTRLHRSERDRLQPLEQIRVLPNGVRLVQIGRVLEKFDVDDVVAHVPTEPEDREVVPHRGIGQRVEWNHLDGDARQQGQLSEVPQLAGHH